MDSYLSGHSRQGQDDIGVNDIISSNDKDKSVVATNDLSGDSRQNIDNDTNEGIIGGIFNNSSGDSRHIAVVKSANETDNDSNNGRGIDTVKIHLEIPDNNHNIKRLNDGEFNK